MRRAVLLLAIAAASAALLWFLLVRPTPTAPATEPAPRPADATSEPERPRAHVGAPPGTRPEPGNDAVPAPDVASGLRDALAGGDVDRTRAAAAALRRLLRTDPAAWDEAVRRLLDPTESAAVREALALVLGTIDAPRTDAVLLGALRATDATGAPGLVRALLLALGATREPAEEDDVFDFGDRPWGEDGPGGLGITVRRSIEDPAVRSAVAEALDGGPVTTRRAAAVALRHSLANADARDAFMASLRGEEDDAPIAVVGEALAGWARTSPSREERDRILRAILARTTDEGLDGLRVRVTDDLDRVPLPADLADALHVLAESDRPFGQRAFALDVLVGSAGAPGALGDGGAGRTRELLIRTLERATDPALRDLAARHLRRLEPLATPCAALLRALREDPAWNVRYTALETIARLDGADVADAIEAGKQDGDERVRALAAELESARK